MSKMRVSARHSKHLSDERMHTDVDPLGLYTEARGLEDNYQLLELAHNNADYPGTACVEIS